MNENNSYSHCYSPTSPPAITKFRSPILSFGKTSSASASPSTPGKRISATSTSMIPSINETQYDLLPQAPTLPPPNISPSIYEIPISGNGKGSSNNNIYNEPQPIYTKFTFPPDSSIASTS